MHNFFKEYQSNSIAVGNVYQITKIHYDSVMVPFPMV